jgi:hypothetical protein
MNWPHSPTGGTSLAGFLRKLLAAAKSSEIKSGPNYLVRRTCSGTILEIKPGGGAVTDSPAAVGLFKVYQAGQELFLCYKWSATGLTWGDPTHYVAKPTKLRETVASETIGSATINYTYSADSTSVVQKRTATCGTESEIQVIIPRYQVDSLLYCIEFPEEQLAWDSETDQLTTWLDLNVDGRYWARRYSQT